MKKHENVIQHHVLRELEAISTLNCKRMNDDNMVRK